MSAINRRPTADPDETRPSFDLIDEIIPSPEAWVDAFNAHLGGRTPREIETGGEAFVRDLVRAIKHGMFS